MYSEETGEGVLFLKGGDSVRRKLAPGRGHEAVATLRRPDVSNCEAGREFNLSLLGKIIRPQAQKSETVNGSLAPTDAGEMSAPRDGLFGWLRNVFRL